MDKFGKRLTDDHDFGAPKVYPCDVYQSFGAGGALDDGRGLHNLAVLVRTGEDDDVDVMPLLWTMTTYLCKMHMSPAQTTERAALGV